MTENKQNSQPDNDLKRRRRDTRTFSLNSSLQNEQTSTFSEDSCIIGSEPDPFRIGTIIDQRYRIKTMLGEGGFGRVYLVKDVLYPDREIALKILKSNLLSSENLNALKKEFDIMSHFRHPNLVKVSDFGAVYSSHIQTELPDTYYYTMEFIAGVSLKSHITTISKKLQKDAQVRRKEQKNKSGPPPCSAKTGV